MSAQQWSGQQWAPGPAPGRRASEPDGISVVSLLISGAGLVAIVIAFTAVSWVNASAAVTGAVALRYKFGPLGDDTSVTGWAAAYFSWLGWLLLAITALACVGAALPSPARRACIAAGTALGVVGFMATLFAMADLSRQASVSFSDFIGYFGPGPWLAGLGFLIATGGALYGRAGAGR